MGSIISGRTVKKAGAKEGGSVSWSISCFYWDRGREKEIESVLLAENAGIGCSRGRLAAASLQ